MRLICSIAVLFVTLVFVGCKREDVKVYHVAKEKTSTSQPATETTAPNPDDSADALPKLQWTLPDGWQEKAPSQMRVASFIVTNANGQAADVGVIPLPAGENEAD